VIPPVRMLYDTPKKPAFKGSLSDTTDLIAKTQTTAASTQCEGSDP